MRITRESFLSDVAKHEIKIELDNGLFRHVRFEQPRTCNMYFTLTTWPGHLAYSGDMGSYVFSRIPDMFQFFRKGEKDSIDFSYWAEKCEATDKADGIKAYNSDRFRQVIHRLVDEFIAEQPESYDAASLRSEIQNHVIPCGGDGEHWARQAVDEFEHEGFRFHDFWEIDLREYAYRFLWCCYALPWGIRQYDSLRGVIAA